MPSRLMTINFFAAICLMHEGERDNANQAQLAGR